MSVLRTVLKCDRANVSMMAALTAVPLLAMAGVAVDFARAHKARTTLQAAADTAALAGAIYWNLPETKRRTRVEEAFAANFDYPEFQPSVNAVFDQTKATVTAEATVPASLSKIFDVEYVDIGAQAKADRGQGKPICILTLEPTEKEALYLNSDSSIDALGCAVQVNSSHSEAAMYGNSHIDVVADSICVTGNYKANSNANFSPEPETGCPPINDPLASLPAPAEAAGSCTYNDTVVQNGQTKTFAPGRYCGKLEINSGGKAIFQAGVHVLKNVEFTVNSNSTVEGQNVMFYLMGEKGRLNFNSLSTVKLSAPTTGTFAGIAIFQDRNANSDYHIINSNSSSKIEGVIYFPKEDLHLNSQGNLNQASGGWAIVARKLKLNSGSHLHFAVDDGKEGGVPLPPGLFTKGPPLLTQ